MSKRRQKARIQQPASAVPRQQQPSTPPKSQRGGARKMPWWLFAIPAIVMMVAMWSILSCFPETERMMEATNFFVWTPECLAQKMSTYPGASRLFIDWIVQFCKEPTCGFAIEAGMLGIMTLLAALLAPAWGRRTWMVWALVPAVAIMSFFLHRPMITLQAIFFFASLLAVGFTCRKCKEWVTTLVIASIGLLSVWLLSFPVAALMFVLMSLLLLTVKGRGSRLGLVNIILPLCFIVLTVIFVKLWSSSYYFIAYDFRWWFIADSDGQELAVLLMLAIPVVLMFVPLKGSHLFHLGITLAVAIVAAIVCYNRATGDERMQQSEEVYRFSHLADQGEWQQLLSEINSLGAIDNNVYLQFALLAEARLGTLTSNLFLYPINSPESFCPRLEDKPLACDFCRIFYRELGTLDEAFHEAFQYGMLVQRSSGFCAASLRHMAEYSVQMGDRPLAEKYIYLLERTSNNDELAVRLREQLANTPVRPDSMAMRGDYFVKANALTSEMAHALDYDRSNKAVRDYLLCSLLLTKQIELFKTVLNDFDSDFSGSELPRAYAEAAAMINHLQPAALSPQLRYSLDIDRQFEQFTQLHNSGQDDSDFRGTFWYYFVYAQTPPQQNWIQQSQSS